MLAKSKQKSINLNVFGNFAVQQSNLERTSIILEGYAPLTDRQHAGLLESISLNVTRLAG